MTILFTNNASGTLASAVNATATTLTLGGGQGAAFPAPVSPNYFIVTIISASNPAILEIVLVSQVAGDTFTIQRGYEGTAAQSWNANDLVQLRITAAGLGALNASSRSWTFQQTGNFSFTPPAGVTTYYVTAIASGGGGGGAAGAAAVSESDTSICSAGGGGGAGQSIYRLPYTGTLTGTVGATGVGGAGGSSSSVPGANGVAGEGVTFSSGPVPSLAGGAFGGGGPVQSVGAISGGIAFAQGGVGGLSGAGQVGGLTGQTGFLVNGTAFAGQGGLGQSGLAPFTNWSPAATGSGGSGGAGFTGQGNHVGVSGTDGQIGIVFVEW